MTTLRSIKTNDDFSTIVAKKREQEEIANNILMQNRELVKSEGVRCDIGKIKFAKVGERYFRHEQYKGWIETKFETYQKNLKKHEVAKQKLFDEEKEYQALVADGTIPTTIDNLRIVMRYLQNQNLGSWTLPRMSIPYSANQYDCDGKTAVTITLDHPIKFNDSMKRKFVYGASHGYLVRYSEI